jgi:hypothetical protein
MTTVQWKSELLKTQPDLEQPYGGKPSETFLDGVLIWFPLCFLIVWTITKLFQARFAVSILRIPKLVWTASAKHQTKIPCCDCQYFINNSYLKCAVHPITAMTEAAIDCSDFQTNEKNRS